MSEETKDINKVRPKPYPPIMIDDGHSDINPKVLIAVALFVFVAGLFGIPKLVEPSQQRWQQQVDAIRQECDSKGLIVVRDATDRLVCSSYSVK